MPEGIYHIPLRLPWSSPSNVNVYLIEENDGYIMIDCGVDGYEYLDLLKSHLVQIGIDFSDIKLLIGTHMHIDHIGLSGSLRESLIYPLLFMKIVLIILMNTITGQ